MNRDYAYSKALIARSIRLTAIYAAIVWVGGIISTTPLTILFFGFDDIYTGALVVIQWPIHSPLYQALGLQGSIFSASLVYAYRHTLTDVFVGGGDDGR